MKCPRCNGDGSIPYHIADDLFDETNCPLCGGSGEVMTEQEYIQTCNTEQLAEWLQEHMDCASCGCNKDLCYQGYDCCKLAFVEWLKQPHSFE